MAVSVPFSSDTFQQCSLKIFFHRTMNCGPTRCQGCTQGGRVGKSKRRKSQPCPQASQGGEGRISGTLTQSECWDKVLQGPAAGKVGETREGFSEALWLGLGGWGKIMAQPKGDSNKAEEEEPRERKCGGGKDERHPVITGPPSSPRGPRQSG